jgi:hypothetical protein
MSSIQPRLDDRATIDASEMRDFARVLKAALLMIVRYLEKRYCV